mmetsp:Transcript_140938/g.450669  ORF Transcript_140938/g.450669 Transcript_140938/m.450669 type:complete len:374 (-) Transcript_140938:63-1184(-)
MMRSTGRLTKRSLPCLALLCAGMFSGQAAQELEDADAVRSRCLKEHFPQTRSDFPTLLNCLGLDRQAVEVGVQAGVHAQGFLESWRGQRLRLVDKWSPGEAEEDAGASQLFYVDIANIHGGDARRQHRAHCEARLADALREGRAEIVASDSVAAASRIADAELDFVYLDARHDFAGVVTDIRAWWPKVRVGGIFAGHDFVDGEFPEGDFFWISALKEVLPGVEGHVHVTHEQNRYPSFFIIKTEGLSEIAPRKVASETLARRLYAQRSRYFSLWKSAGRGGGGTFPGACRDLCAEDCQERARHWTPTTSTSAGSTLRPFACGEEREGGEADVCGAELVVDVKAYTDVCIERCNVTCKQRSELFTLFGDEILSV